MNYLDTQTSKYSELLALTETLISYPSISPRDEGCQEVLKYRLSQAGFNIIDVPFEDASNFWAIRGEAKPLFVFAGHTDVVPPGDENAWQTPPFIAQTLNGNLHGRGAADMKGSLAAMIIATEKFISEHPNHQGSIGFLITSAEEGPSEKGTPKILEYLQKNNIKPNMCIVGEPTSSKTLGDVIKIGRRGSLTGMLRIYGKQGHIAYPHLADNPIPKALPVLNQLCEQHWDHGNQDFDPTQFQISNFRAGTGAGNVIPGDVEVLFNFRYSPESNEQALRAVVHNLLDNADLRYELDWTHFGEPYYTSPDSLLCQTTKSIIEQKLGICPDLSTSGGTSDGRYIAPIGCDVIELGPCNKTIHQVNESVKVSDLQLLCEVYQAILLKLLVGSKA